MTEDQTLDGIFEAYELELMKELDDFKKEQENKAREPFDPDAWLLEHLAVIAADDGYEDEDEDEDDNEDWAEIRDEWEGRP